MLKFHLQRRFAKTAGSVDFAKTLLALAKISERVVAIPLLGLQQLADMLHGCFS